MRLPLTPNHDVSEQLESREGPGPASIRVALERWMEIVLIQLPFSSQLLAVEVPVPSSSARRNKGSLHNGLTESVKINNHASSGVKIQEFESVLILILKAWADGSVVRIWARWPAGRCARWCRVTGAGRVFLLVRTSFERRYGGVEMSEFCADSRSEPPSLVRGSRGARSRWLFFIG